MSLVDWVLRVLIVSTLAVTFSTLLSEGYKFLTDAPLSTVYEADWYLRNPVGSEGWREAWIEQAMEAWAFGLVSGGIVWGIVTPIARPRSWMGTVVSGVIGFASLFFVLAVVFVALGNVNYEHGKPDLISGEGVMRVLALTGNMLPYAGIAGFCWGSVDRFIWPWISSER